MNANRLFFPQQALDEWLESGRITLVGEELTVLPEGRMFGLTQAVRFMAEVAEGSDPHDLVGKVKTLEQVQAMAAEYCTGSVILGDNAYEIVDGFLAQALPATSPATKPTDAGSTGDALSEILTQV